jgi:hypothetical protein
MAARVQAMKLRARFKWRLCRPVSACYRIKNIK